MGIFDYSAPSSFSMGSNPLPTWEDFDFPDYTTYGGSDPAMGNPDPLAKLLGGFDKQGRYGITDEDRKSARFAGLGDMLMNLGRAGMAGAAGGIDAQGQAFAAVPGAYAAGREKELDDRGQRKLAAELTKLDMTSKYTEIEKDKLALQMAQEQYDDRTEFRKGTYAAFEAAFSPEKQAMIIAELPEYKQEISNHALNLARSYMKIGEVERAMVLVNQVRGDMPEEVKLKWENLENEARARTYGQEAGKNDANLEYNADVQKTLGGGGLEGYKFNSEGKLIPLSPFEIQNQKDVLATNQLQMKDITSQIDRRTELNKRGDAQEAKDRQAALNAATAVNAARRGMYKFDNNGQLVRRDGKTMTPSEKMSPGAQMALKTLEFARQAEERLKLLGIQVPPDGVIDLSVLEGGADSGGSDTQAQVEAWFRGNPELANLPLSVLAQKVKQRFPEATDPTAIANYLRAR